MTKEDIRQEFDFRMRKIVLRGAADAGIQFEPERVQWDVVEEQGKLVVQAIFHLITKEDVIEGIPLPANRWELLKDYALPKFLKKRFPVKYKEIIAEHKFPEVDAPVLGKEFVHLEIR
jgi:hypothetical protein